MIKIVEPQRTSQRQKAPLRNERAPQQDARADHYLCIYRDTKLLRSQPDRWHYNIVISNDRERQPFDSYPGFSNHKWELIAMRRIPRVWSKRLTPDLFKVTIDKTAALAGYATYTVDILSPVPTAINNTYYPRRHMRPSTSALHFPYYIESVLTHHLKKSGVQVVHSSYNVSYKRMRQLKWVGVPIRRDVPIDTWLYAQGSGIRNHLALLREANGSITGVLALLESQRP